MMIAVEGMDGVGKTEISKYISDKYNFKYVEKPLHYFYNDGPENNYADLMQVANRLYDVEDSVVRSWYFNLGNVYVSRLFKDQDVVVDRYLVSSYYWNGDMESDPVFKALIEVSGHPDMTILLYATPRTRMERMNKRDPNDPDLLDEEKRDDGFQKMINFLDKFELPYTVINTEGKPLEEVKGEVDLLIKQMNEHPKQLVRKNENLF